MFRIGSWIIGRISYTCSWKLFQQFSLPVVQRTCSKFSKNIGCILLTRTRFFLEHAEEVKMWLINEFLSKKLVLENFSKFTGKDLGWWSFLVKFTEKSLYLKCFPKDFGNFFIAAFSWNTSKSAKKFYRCSLLLNLGNREMKTDAFKILGRSLENIEHV